MDHDQTAAIAFAAWPELRTPWLDDLRRMSKYAPVLGRFVTFRQLFDSGDMPGKMVEYKASEYLTPNLVQAVALLPPERGLVVTGDSKGRVEIRDAINGQRLHAFQAHELAVDAIALSPDGKALATVGRDEGGVNVWNVEKITSAVKEPEKVRAN